MQDNYTRLGGHEVVIGRTQSGKTHYAVKARANFWRGPVLFFNPQGFPPPGDYIAVTGRDNLGQIMQALRAGLRLSYIPSDRDEIAEQELSCLVGAVFSADWPQSGGLLFVADESQDFSRPLRRIARRGLARGVTGVFISQRPAEMHNTLLTQAIRHVIFSSAWESQYFKRYGLDADKIAGLLAAAPKYSYLVVANGCISGPYQV